MILPKYNILTLKNAFDYLFKSYFYMIDNIYHLSPIIAILVYHPIHPKIIYDSVMMQLAFLDSTTAL